MIPSDLYGIESSTPKTCSFKENLGLCIGRIWSTCTNQLFLLIARIKEATIGRFIERPQAQLEHPKTIQPTSLTERLKQEELAARGNPVTAKLAHSPLPERILSPLPSPKLAPLDPNPKEELKIEQQAKESDQANEQKSPTVINVETQPAVVDETKVLQDPKHLVDDAATSTIIQVEEQHLTRAQRRKLRKEARGVEVPLSAYAQTSEATPAQKTPAAKSTTDSPPKKKEPKIIECGGGGDCQLHSIAEGLKRLHPDVTKLNKEGKAVPYTADDLRTMGVDFARRNIEELSDYTEEILGHIGSDRAEHNWAEVEDVQREWEKEKSELEAKRKKIKLAAYEKQKKEINLKFTEKADILEQAIIIKDDVEFLNRLNTPGFSCSTLHLFTLSLLLDIPIHVHDRDGVKGHDIQIFSPKKPKKETEESKKEAEIPQKEPIHLYRRGPHYMLMLFEKG